MNVKVIGDEVYVTLSERNLLTLLSKVQREGSRNTLSRQTEDGYFLSVTAEEDAAHYQGRAAGEVHPADDPQNTP